MNAWIQHFAEETLARAEREIEALVAVSTPSGDRAAAEEAVAVASALARVQASRPDGPRLLLITPDKP